MQLPAHAGGGTNPFAPNVVGSYSNQGMKPGAHGKPNAKINQDRGLITYPLADDRSMALLAVYDGHGANGEQVSEFVMVKVPDLLEEAGARQLWDDTAGLLKRAFDGTDKQLRESTIAAEVSGSTGVAVLLQGERIWTANVGDSRAVIGRKRKGAAAKEFEVQALTDDQKPDTPEEQARIQAAGGYVSAESSEFGPARVWLRPGEGPGLAMARSLGDHICKRVGVISTPEVKCFDATPEDAILVLASDGVWEFVSNEQAIAIVAAHASAQRGCAALINEATKRWRKEEGSYRDDITAIVVRLPLGLQSLARGSAAAGTQAETQAERGGASAAAVATGSATGKIGRAHV